MKKFLFLIFVLSCFAGCATKVSSVAELQDYYDLRDSIFQGMRVEDLMKAAGREPHVIGQEIDKDIFVFMYQTSEGGLDRHFQRVIVEVDRETGAVENWRM